MPRDIHAIVTSHFVTKLIRRKTREVTRNYFFRALDADDIEQRLLLKLLERLRKYQARKGHDKAFVTRVIETQVATLIEHHSTPKRDDRDVSSLSTSIRHDERDELLANLVTEAEGINRTQGAVRTASDEAELSELIATVLQDLPPDMRILAEQLQSASVAVLARQLGLPRTTLRDRLQRLRCHPAIQRLASAIT